jgi:acetylornithine aminotransferase
LIRGIPFKDEKAPGELVRLARERGVLLLTAGKDAVRLVPALVVSNEECDHAIGVIETCLSIMQEQGWGWGKKEKA